MSHKVNRVIIGLRYIAIHFTQSFYNINNVNLIVVASTTKEKLNEFKEEFNISVENYYSNYENYYKIKKLYMLSKIQERWPSG